MSTQITNYRVFIASPGGLDDERNAFRQTLVVYSESDALPRGALFSPIGWEATLRGVGRAQAIINEEVKQCDFFVLLLWDRWGTPTGGDGKYTSGTEEEYAIAWECFTRSAHPMREIIVFFKAVTPRQLSDPGEQLRKVLDFKKRLEDEKLLFFDTFDDLAAFQEKLRRYLAQWLRLHEAGERGKMKTPSLDPNEARKALPQDFLAINTREAPSSVGGKKSNLTRKAEQLAKRKKLTEAEALFTQAISRFDDPLAFRSYSEFLISQRRWVQAEAVVHDLARLAETLRSPSWAAYAHVKLGAICMAQGKMAEAVKHLENALAYNEILAAPLHIMRTLGSLGFAYYRLGEFRAAEAAWKRCLDMNIRRGNWADAGNVLERLAHMATRERDKPRAIEYLEGARDYFDKAKALKRAKAVTRQIEHVRGRQSSAAKAVVSENPPPSLTVGDLDDSMTPPDQVCEP